MLNFCNSTYFKTKIKKTLYICTTKQKLQHHFIAIHPKSMPVCTWRGIHPSRETLRKLLPTFFQPLNNSDFNKHISRNRLPMAHHTKKKNKPLLSNKSKTCQYICISTRNAICNRASIASQQYAHISQLVLKASNGLTEKIMDESNSHYIDKWTYVGNESSGILPTGKYFLQNNCSVYKFSVLQSICKIL